ncbi:MAG: hypothetical protein WCE54_13785, partial [Ignavibacteriaceae bacterium]
LVASATAFSKLNQYKKLLNDIQKLDKKDSNQCPEISNAVTDYAFNAEANSRLLIKNALDSINDLRDSGALYQIVDDAGKELSKMKSIEILNRLETEGKKAKEQFGSETAEIFSEAVKSLKSLDIKLSAKEGKIIVNKKIVGDQSAKVELSTKRQPGQMGRISSDEFFSGKGGRIFVSPGQLYLPPDCHHKPPSIKESDRIPADIYAGTVSGLAMTKGLFYQHARRVMELGPRGLRGEDPVTAILIAIAVIGAALVIYGIATGDGFITAFGAVLIAGAALVAFGGFSLILAIVA